jgi:polysaccharide pyruvyl transferase WcaK-like protein
VINESSSRTRVLILWADQYSANLGVRALAEGAAAVAADVWPGSEIVMQDFAPNQDGFSLGRRAMIGELRSREITRWLDQFDVVLDTGAGDSYSDIYGLWRLTMMTVTQRARLRSRKPLIFLPQTIGPFGSSLSRAIARSTLRRTTAIFTRDSASTDEVRRVSGLTPTQSTDMVFALPKQRVPQVLDVVVNVSGLLWQANSHVDHLAYQASTIRVIEQLLNSGRSLAILPHVLDNPSTDNDLRAVDELTDRFPDLSVLKPESLHGAREMLASSRLVIGARMHACLNALSQGIPALPWAYSRKFAPLLKDLGWEYTLDLRNDKDIADHTIQLIEGEDLAARAVQVEKRGTDLISVLREELIRRYETVVA